jgi:hypothetical protein
MRRALPILVLLVSLCAPLASLRADDTVAQTQFSAAKKLYDDGKYTEALQLFQLAWDYSHSPNARLYVAKCFLKLDNLIAAYDEFRGTVQDATERIASDPKYQDTQNAAAAELVLLEPRIGRLIVTLDAAGLDGVEVTLNGAVFPSVSLGDAVTVAPGSYAVAARAKGRDPIERKVEVAPGKTVAVALAFPREGAAPPAPDPEPPAAAAETSLSTLQIVGIALFGLGAATLTAAAGTGIAAGSKFDVVEQACAEGPCDARFNDTIDSGKTLEIATYILLGAGGALTIGGASMWIFGGDGATEPAAAAAIVPLAGGGFVSVGGRF